MKNTRTADPDHGQLVADELAQRQPPAALDLPDLAAFCRPAYVKRRERWGYSHGVPPWVAAGGRRSGQPDPRVGHGQRDVSQQIPATVSTAPISV